MAVKPNPDFSLKLKLLLINHGKCSACTDKPKVKYCGRCFNTRLEPGVLEALTVLDLGTKLKESQKLIFENVSEDDYSNPPEGSYFSHVLERKKKLEGLYDELRHAPAGSEREAMRRLIRAAVLAKD
jgi:hypothetical protein